MIKYLLKCICKREFESWFSNSKEYEKMYNAIKTSDWKIDITNSEYLVEELKEFSYISYNDYTHWNKLKNKIVTI